MASTRAMNFCRYCEVRVVRVVFPAGTRETGWPQNIMEPISKQKIQQRKSEKQLPTNFTTYTLLFILFSLIYECQLKEKTI